MKDSGKDIKVFKVTREEQGKRLDIFLTDKVEISRSHLQKLIADGFARVNQKIASKHYLVKENDIIELEIPPPQKIEFTPEKIPLEILYEDSDLIVLSKQPNLVVHPAHGHPTGTLVHALLYHSKKLAKAGELERPGIVHRLDKDTSGLMVVAKNKLTHEKLAAQVKKRTLKRTYQVLVQGNIKNDEGTIVAPIGRGSKDPKKMVIAGRAMRDAVTGFKVLKRFGDYTLLEVNLETGRTHQIRVHMRFINHPVVGDKEYGIGARDEKKLALKRQFLHATKLTFTHPTSKKRLSFSSPLPEDLQEVLRKL